MSIADDFLKCLPENYIKPEHVFQDCDSEATIEWYTPRGAVSISISDSGLISYATILKLPQSSAGSSGEVQFDGRSIPKELLNKIEDIASNDSYIKLFDDPEENTSNNLYKFNSSNEDIDFRIETEPAKYVFYIEGRPQNDDRQD